MLQESSARLKGPIDRGGPWEESSSETLSVMRDMLSQEIERERGGWMVDTWGSFFLVSPPPSLATAWVLGEGSWRGNSSLARARRLQPRRLQDISLGMSKLDERVHSAHHLSPNSHHAPNFFFVSNGMSEILLLFSTIFGEDKQQAGIIRR